MRGIFCLREPRAAAHAIHNTRTPHACTHRSQECVPARRSLFLAGELADAHRVSVAGRHHVPSDTRLGGVFDEALPPVEAATAQPLSSSAEQQREALGGFETVQMPRGGFCHEALTRDLPGGEAAFGAQPYVFTSRAPLLSREACQRAIEAAEARAQQDGGGTTSRHYEVPTTDLPMRTLTSVLPWFRAVVSSQELEPPSLLMRL